jgi:hypothetical protein
MKSQCAVTGDEIGRARRMQGEKRNAERILVGKPEGKIKLRRVRHKSVHNKMYPR